MAQSPTPNSPTSETAPASKLEPAVTHPSGKPRSARYGFAACVAITLLSIFCVAFLAGQNYEIRQQLKGENPLGLKLPALDAAAAVSSDKFSMATGLLSTSAEGLFVLDHNSGLLQCSVMYPRSGQFAGLFTANVNDTLGTGKGAQYMMATGLVDLPSNNATPFGMSVVYVLNTSTGAYACYAVPFNRTAMNANRPQQAILQLVATGKADPIIDRN